MIRFGYRYCANCKHFPESYPVVSERCRRCEETSGPPTNYQPQELTATTICHTNPENVTESAGLGDAITATASPRPWAVDAATETHQAYTIRSTKAAVAIVWREADAPLIVLAVNERDRLRDIVRRLADSLQGIMDAADGKGEGVLDESLLREARAAIGEGAANG